MRFETVVTIRHAKCTHAACDDVYKKPKYVLLDEIQNVPQWELFVNRLQRQGYNLIITGSNAHLLSSELSTHLTGRHIPIFLLPFSFGEFLASSSLEKTESEKIISLHTYIKNGGFPEPMFKSIGMLDYLSALVESILYKDIIKRYRIRGISGIEDLMKYLVSNVACEYSFQSLAKVTACKSFHTVEKYLKMLEESFLFFSLKRFSFKVKEQVRSNRKMYCIDNGIVTAKAFQFSSNTGKLAENCVAITLYAMSLCHQIEFYFWKNQRHEEVDFVVKQHRQITHLIQVCWKFQIPETKKREIRSLLSASKELACRNLVILNEDYEATEECAWFGKKEKIHFIPLWKWLIDPGVVL